MTRFFILSISILLFCCKSVKKPDSTAVPIIMMEKTTCYGTCPAYKFEVYLNKEAHYTGKANVTNIGTFTGTLTDQQLDQLKNSFVEADYFSFANVYSASVTDLPTTYVYYNDGKQSSKVTDYYGAPEKLKALENKIEEVINGIDWQEK